jgi:nitrogen fixation protein FixH
MNRMAPRSEWQVTGRFVFGLFVAFFGVIIAVNATMAVFASRSWTGLVVENGYVASQHFNSDLALLRQQEKLGWTEHLETDSGVLVLEYKRRDGSPISGLAVTASITRPIGDREDRTITLIETRPGHYESSDRLHSGRWIVDVTARKSESESIRKIHDVVIAETRP